ncbi:MAG: recombination mediator RecR [Gemmatales bacterium]|nr:recombination mediator RecR [Gemmatales bacterium]MDW8174084.1 recombination mediator RecR [Gemmatales bacterium]
MTKLISDPILHQGEVLGRVWEHLNRWPGIGPKSAERLLYYLLSTDKSEVLDFARALQELTERIHPCRQCHHWTEHELCSICSDPKRDSTLLCVVEQPRDVIALERCGVYRGHYHVLWGRLAPLEGIGPERLTVDSLLRRVQEGRVREVILATNPNFEGDGTALYLSSVLSPVGVKVTRLARGLPSGSSLEFANSAMLADALEGRRAL